MNAIELTLTAKIAAICINKGYEPEAIIVTIKEDGVYLQFNQKYVEFQLIATASIEEAQEWAMNGRKNWRRLHKAVAMAWIACDCNNPIDEELSSRVWDMQLTEDQIKALPFFDRNGMVKTSTFEEVEAIVEWLANNFPTEETVAQAKAKDDAEQAYQEERDAIYASVYEQYGKIVEQKGFFGEVSTTDEGQEVLDELLAELDAKYNKA